MATTEATVPDAAEVDPDGEREAGRRLRRSRGALFALVLAVFVTSPVVTNADSYLAVPTAQSMLLHHDLGLDEYPRAALEGHYVVIDEPGRELRFVRDYRQGDEGPSALLYDYFPWTSALFAMPAVAGLELLGAVGVDAADVDEMITSGEMGVPQVASAALVTALAVLALSMAAWEGLERLPARRRRRAAFAVGLVVALATPAWSTLSRALWNQTPAVLLASVAVLAAVRLAMGRGRPVVLALVLGASLAGAFTVRPTMAVLGGVLAVWVTVTHRRLLGWCAVGAVAVLVPFLAVNLATFGQPLLVYHDSGRIGHWSAAAEGALGSLVAPNRGLLVFSPVVALAVLGAIWGMRDRGPLPKGLTVAAVAGCLLHLLVVATSEEWWAGHAFGPRFTADLLPLLVLLALPVVEVLASPARPRALATAALALVAVSVAVHSQGAWSKPTACWNAEPRDVNDAPERAWDADDLQVLRGVARLADTGSPAEAVLGRCRTHERNQ